MANYTQDELKEIEDSFLEVTSTIEVMRFLLNSPQDVHDNIDLIYGLQNIVNSLNDKINPELLAKIRYN